MRIGDASERNPLSTADRQSRNIMMNAWHALAEVEHPYSSNFQGYYTRHNGQAAITQSLRLLQEIRDYLRGELNAGVAENRDFVVCDENAYQKATAARQLDPSLPAVVTLLEAGMSTLPQYC